MEKLVFLETWKMNWGSAKATNHCGTFTLCSQEQAASGEASELGQGRVHNDIIYESGVFHVPSMLSYVDVIFL